MKRKNKTLVTFLILIPTVILIVFLSAPIHKEAIPTRFVTGENMGFDLTLGHLNFGKIVPGHSSSRSMSITNNYDHPTITRVKSSGEISPYLIVSKNNFILQPTQSINLTFQVFPSKDLPYTEYPGQITITTNKA